jgi:hypothetical protein
MSRYTKIDIEIKRFNKDRYQAIADALTEEWDFEGFGTHTATDNDASGLTAMGGSGCDQMQSDGEDVMLATLTKAAWKANGAFCEVKVDFTDLDSAPCETRHGAREEYNRLKLNGELED